MTHDTDQNETFCRNFDALGSALGLKIQQNTTSSIPQMANAVQNMTMLNPQLIPGIQDMTHGLMGIGGNPQMESINPLTGSLNPPIQATVPEDEVLHMHCHYRSSTHAFKVFLLVNFSVMFLLPLLVS